MLVGLSMLAGTAGAMAAETTTTYDFEDGEALFSVFDGARASVAVEDNADEGSKVLKFNCNNMNKVAFAYYDFSSLVVNASKVSVSFDCNIPSSGQSFISLADASKHTGADGGFTGKSTTGYGTNGSIIAIGADRISGTDAFAVNRVAKDGALGEWIKVNIDVDVIGKTVSYTIKNSIGDVLVEESDVAFYNDAANACSQIDIYKSRNGSDNILLDNITITSYVDENQTFADYTINYVDGETTVKSSTGSGMVGTSVESETIITDTLGQKYLLVGDSASTMTLVEGENVLNVPVRKPYTTTLSVTQVVAGETSEPVETVFTETDDKVCEWSYVWPLYIAKDGVYYKADNTAFAESGTFDGETGTIEKTVTYSSVDNSVVYFGEWETDCTSGGSSYPTSAIDGFSNGKGKAVMKTDLTMSLTFSVAQAGKYNLSMPYYNSNSKARSHTILLDEETIAEGVSVDSKSGDTFAYEAELAAGEHTVTIKCVYSLTSVFDYLLVTGETTTGIDEINAAKTVGNAAVYNLKGQRIAQPTKGLYIMNGKKVIVK